MLIVDDRILIEVNLSYRDPATIDMSAWTSRTDPDLLVVPRAGEYLYRLGVQPK